MAVTGQVTHGFSAKGVVVGVALMGAIAIAGARSAFGSGDPSDKGRRAFSSLSVCSSSASCPVSTPAPGRTGVRCDEGLRGRRPVRGPKVGGGIRDPTAREGACFAKPAVCHAARRGRCPFRLGKQLIMRAAFDSTPVEASLVSGGSELTP